MHCKDCIYWREPYQTHSPKKDRYWEVEPATYGKCTLNPKWIETRDTHYCGQFFPR